VRALTGMEPDRWAEERRRGMTIDLGFAWTTLPTGPTVAFVDVPGHERFVPNMLAGVGPVPAVLFVVAADEGWMPQSREHLEALHALNVQHGLLAVTRSDLMDPELAREEALEHLAGSSLGQIPAVCVSAATGAGLDELRAALGSQLAGLPAPDVDADVRLLFSAGHPEFLTTTPSAASWGRAASISDTTSCIPCTDPGAETRGPMLIEQAEPGGVNCTTRKLSPSVMKTPP